MTDALVTKSCNLTETEVMQLMSFHGYNLGEDTDAKVERIRYLNSRLKAFREAGEDKPKAEAPKASETAAASSTWGTGA